MSWWPWGEKAGEAAVSRSSMRDAMNRLRSIILRSGLQLDEGEGSEMKSTGDPFQDKVNWFTKSAKSLSEQIAERNKNQREQLGSAADLAADSHDINKRLGEMRSELDQLKEILADDEKKKDKAIKKAKDPEGKDRALIESLERTYRERSTSYQNCSNVLEQLKDLNAARMMSEEEAKKQSGAGRGSGAPKGMRSTLDRLKQKRKDNRIDIGAMSGDGGGEGSSDLAKNNETAAEYAALKEKQRKQDEALAQLANVLGEIQDGARKIGDELDKQNKMLDKQADTVDRLTGKLQTLNKGLDTLLKAQKGTNVTIYVIVCLLILAIVGIILVQTGAV